MTKKENINHADRAHAVLSASASERWINCPPSALLESELPESTSVYAEEGTLAHELSEVKLIRAINGATAISTKLAVSRIKKHELYKNEMDGYTSDYVDYCMTAFNEVKAKDDTAIMIIEKRADFSDIVPNGFGTADNVIIGDGKLIVTDLKYGVGVQVFAANNSQLMLYALGCFSEYWEARNIETVILRIAQVRKNHFDEWEIPASELLKWADKITPIAKLANEGKGEKCAGEWCKFCKVKVRCAALMKQTQKAFAVHVASQNGELTDDEITELLRIIPVLDDWFKSVRAYAIEEAKNGKEWSGFLLVPGQSRRAIVEPEKAAETLEFYGYEDSEIWNVKKSLKGIGELEKLLTPAKFNKYIGRYVVKAPGAPILVDETKTNKTSISDKTENAKRAFENFED